LLSLSSALPEDAIIAGSLGYAYGISKEFENARAIYCRLQRMFEHHTPSCGYPLAMIAVALGREEEAIQWLQQSFMEECFHTLTLKTDPLFAVLRGNPGFERLVEQSQAASGQLAAHIFPEPPDFMKAESGRTPIPIALRQKAGG
jgi:hypothetical protein